MFRPCRRSGETAFVQILDERLRRDSRRAVDDGQTAAGMRAAADKVNVLEIFKAIVGTEVEHLPEIVGQIEGRSVVDVVVVLPICRRHHQLRPNAFFRIVDTDLSLIHI